VVLRFTMELTDFGQLSPDVALRIDSSIADP
jgi:hypothetical protein